MAREIVFHKNLGSNGVNTRKSVTDAQAKFLVQHGIASYVEQKQMAAAKEDKPKKAGRPKKNTYQTKDMVAED